MKIINRELHDCFSRYVQSLNLPCVTNTLNARNYVESDEEELKKEEEDGKSISLGMPMLPQEEDEEELLAPTHALDILQHLPYPVST